MRRLLTILLLLISFNSFAEKHYVKIGGGGAGTLASPFATIAQLNAHAIVAGDSVLFYAGDSWREELEIQEGSSGANNRVTYTRYGEGANPRILGSVKAITWTETAYANRWESATNVPINPDAYAAGFSASGNIYFERTGTYPHWGAFKTYTANLGNLVAEYDYTWNGNVLYVYAASDPDTRYVAIEAGQETFCSSTPNDAASYFTFDGIDLLYAKGAGYHAGYPEAAGQTDVTFRNCNIAYIGAKGQSFAYGIEAFHSNLLVEDCSFSDCGRRAISFNFYNADDIGTMSNVIIRNNTFKRGQHTTSLDLAWAVSDDMADVTGIYFYNNVIDDSEITMADDEFSNQIYIEGYSTNTYNLYIVNNVFIKSTARNILISGADNPHIWNNTVYGHNVNAIPNPYANVSFNSNTANKLIDIDYRNNIMFNDLSNNALDSYGLLAEYAPTTFEYIDYNLYWQVEVETDKTIIGYHGDYYTRNEFATWKSDYSFDDNSPNPSVPHWVDSVAFNFNLKSSSPANGTGVVLAYVVVTDAHGGVDTINKYDIAGNLRSRATPSIGAYEYDASPDVEVSSITVSGAGNATTIETDGGTLQMSAAILPVDATVQTVTWSVTNGTGTATISSGGLLTATGDGTVTVRASANDGSGVYDDQVITISNQTSDPPVISSPRSKQNGKWLRENGKFIII